MFSEKNQKSKIYKTTKFDEKYITNPKYVK